jgi:hypothetical protein
MRTTLSIERLDRVPVSVTLSPGLSMLAIITDTLSGRVRGAPESWRRLVRSSVAPRDDLVVRTLASPGFTVLPDVVLPGDFTKDLDVGAQLEMLRDLPPESLLTELEEITDGQPPPHWQPVVDDPARWLRGYADLVAQTWTAMSGLWTRVRPLLDREVERVAVAAARGTLDAVLANLHSGCNFHDGTFSFPDLEPERFSIGSRGLVLMPMLSGPKALISRLDGPDAAWIGYPLPAAGSLAPASPPSREDPLTLIVGDVRATILAGLDRPLTMSQVARRLQQAPNVISYHCDRLESAGLILRHRTGRQIWVHRTDRADALVSLLRS